jgi:hypothetical protein
MLRGVKPLANVLRSAPVWRNFGLKNRNRDKRIIEGV